MSGGGGSAPEPDPLIGEAAKMSAQTGQDFLAYMQEQAKITNGWAETDRNRQQTTYIPLQDQYIEDAQAGPDYRAVDRDVRAARADVTNQFSQARGQEQRRMAAMGVDPSSGRGRSVMQRSQTAEALAGAGTANNTRLTSRARAEAEADQKMTNAINMGSGLAVNPGTSMGISNGATGAGFGGAMQGLGQQGQLLNTQYNQQMQTYQANQASQNSLMGGLGSLVGLGVSMWSSKDYKEDKRPARGVLDAVRDMPVEKWKYKDGIADGGEHVGPYAEDFQKVTGQGDGRSIPMQDMLGMTMGAVQELADKVDTIAQGKTGARGKSRGVMEAMG